MRTLLKVLSALTLICVFASLQAQEVSIPDPGLAAAIRGALQKPVGPLTAQDLLTLTNLDAHQRNIARVEGLEAAQNLVALDLRQNQLTNFAFPVGLARLTHLDLSFNSLSTLTLPPDVTQLSSLALDGNPLATVVLSKALAASPDLAGTIAGLQHQGVDIIKYPLTVELVLRERLIGAFRFGITGPPGIYTVFSSPDLDAWSVLGTADNPLGGVFFLDPGANLSARKFYRAQRQDPPTNMVFVPPNTFKMGSPASELHRDANEGPQTTVTLSHGFWIGKYEVTQGEYLSVTGTNPSQFPGDLQRPVSSVSWPDATNYCGLLTQRELAAGRIPTGSQYRLPTEAEWECAARAGTSTRFSYGDDTNYASLQAYAWQSIDEGGLTVHPVGQKLPNPWGLYDMAGNVFEWCQDWVGPLPGGAVTDPQGPPSNPIGVKIMRGGAFDMGGSFCRSASRQASPVGSSRVDLQACKLEYSIVSPK